MITVFLLLNSKPKEYDQNGQIVSTEYNPEDGIRIYIRKVDDIL